jgi:hypothetical protein
MNWYYAKNGAQQGPVALEDMKSRIAMGEIAPSDLAWREGMADWMPVSSIAELKLEPAPPRPEHPNMPAHTPVPAPMATSSPEPYRAPQASPSAAPAPYQGAQPPSQGMAIASLICGIVSLVACCLWFGALPLALVAIVLGFIASSKAKADPARYAGKGMARAGIVTGILGLIAAGVVTYFALQFQGLSPEEMQEKILNMLPLNDQQKEEFRREMEKEQQRQRGQ